MTIRNLYRFAEEDFKTEIKEDNEIIEKIKAVIALEEDVDIDVEYVIEINEDEAGSDIECLYISGFNTEEISNLIDEEKNIVDLYIKIFYNIDTRSYLRKKVSLDGESFDKLYQKKLLCLELGKAFTKWFILGDTTDISVDEILTSIDKLLQKEFFNIYTSQDVDRVDSNKVSMLNTIYKTLLYAKGIKEQEGTEDSFATLTRSLKDIFNQKEEPDEHIRGNK